jgi:Protein of unknown function (DUF1264)
MRTITALGLFVMACILFVAALVGNHAVSAAPAPQAASANKTPADDFTVHVSAPHIVNGKQMGPFHHYCKVYSNDPKIVCLIFDDTQPGTMLTQVEWIWAKKLTRTSVPLSTWNKNWHDHKVEIASGRVQVHDLPPDKAKEVADLVANTDGLIYSFEMKDGIPTGGITIPQAVGHKPMTMAEWKNYEDKMAPK